MGFTLTTPPSIEPVSVLEAMRHVRLDVSNAAPVDDVIVTVVAPGAATDDTTVPVSPLTIPFAVGDVLKFDVGKAVIIAAAALVDDEEITVEALPFDLDPGVEAIIAGGDPELRAMIAAARHQAERYTSAGIVSQVWTLTLDGFPLGGSEIPLPRGPVLSLDSITYLNADGERVTLADDPLSDLAVLDQATLSANVSLVDGASWPVTASQKAAVAIAFTVGYGTTAAEVPGDIKAALLLRIGDLYRNREAQSGAPLTENKTVCALLDPHVRTPLA